MSYSIQYGPEIPKFAPREKGHRALTVALLVLMVCSAVIGWAIPKQAQQFVQALFPLTRIEVRSSMAQLCDDVKDGLPLDRAVSAFCQDIIYESRIP